MEGMGEGAWMARQHVSGRLRERARVVKEVLVSPRPWRRRRMFTGKPVWGGIIESVRAGGKSVVWGSRGIVEEDILKFYGVDGGVKNDPAMRKSFYIATPQPPPARFVR